MQLVFGLFGFGEFLVFLFVFISGSFGAAGFCCDYFWFSFLLVSLLSLFLFFFFFWLFDVFGLSSFVTPAPRTFYAPTAGLLALF